MKPLTADEAKKWCEVQGTYLNEGGHLDRPAKGTTFAIPSDAGRRVALAAGHLGVDFFEGESETLVWFQEWGVWPSGERMHIWTRFAASYGEARPLHEASAFLFSQQEDEDVRSFVTLGLLFLWDVVVARPSTLRLLFYSHDEVGWIA